MNKLMKKFEDMMVAITFAEAGEYEAAKEMAGNAQAKAEETAPDTAPESA